MDIERFTRFDNKTEILIGITLRDAMTVKTSQAEVGVKNIWKNV